LRPLDEDSCKEELEGTDALDVGRTVVLLTGVVALLVVFAALELTFAELESTVAELEGVLAELLARIVELERGRAADEPATALELAVLMALELLALTAVESFRVTALELFGVAALESFGVTAVESFESALSELLNTLSLVVSAGADFPDELDFLRDEDDFELEDCVPSWEGLLMSSELPESGSIELSLEISSSSE
jgi:hypothetical protein